MNATLGIAGVVLGVTASALGIVTLAVGLRQKRPQLLQTGWSYSLLVLLGAVVAVVAMQRALITRDFTVGFVHDNGSSRTPRLFNVATMWSALEGSILLWALILAGFTVHVARKFRRRLADPLVGFALLTMLVVCLFFFLLMLGPANPFTTVAVPAGYDGPGPNPLLQEHILMAIHPPMLYLGYVGFTVPFAFAIAALATGRLGEGWLVETRRATLLAWGFLTIGIILGAWWSYEVLGLGRLLGLGPRRERVAAAVADRHRLPALGDGAGAARDAPRLEPVAPVRHLQPHHPGHLPHPLRGARVGARLQRQRHRRCGSCRSSR